MICREVDTSVVHMLTRESQEVGIAGMIRPRIISDDELSVPKMLILLVPIPHCGQLNITTRTLSTPALPGVLVKLKVILVEAADVLSVSSPLAHSLPSSSVSVGITPSYRKLLVCGIGHSTIPRLTRTVPLQWPSCVDPFTETISEDDRV